MYRLSKSSKYPLLQQTDYRSARNNIDWYKVGEVEELYTYPVFEGFGVYTPICIFSEFDMSGIVGRSVEECFRYRNDMFAVYNCETYRIIKATDNTRIRTIQATFLNDSNIKISFFSKFIVIDLPKVLMTDLFTCTTSFCHKRVVEMLCFDCGPEAAEWISRCLNDKNARLAYHSREKPGHKVPMWKYYQQLYSEQRDESLYCKELDERYFEPSLAPVLDYKLMPLLDYNSLSKPLASAAQLHKLRPNIIIKVNKFDDLFEWKWIMIGSTILQYKHINPFPRQTKLNLGSIPIQMLSRFIPLHCNMFIPGIIQVGDDVFVKKAPPPLETAV